MPQQQFDPNEFAPKKRPNKPPAGVQKFPTKELLGTMWGTEDSLLPPIKGITRPALPSSEGSDWQGWDDMKWLYENVAVPSSSAVGAASDWLTGKAIGAVAKPIIGGAANLYKKFRGASEVLPPIRNVEAPIAELPPVKPTEVLDTSGRVIAPPQAELPVRPNGPWGDNIAELPPVKPDSPVTIPNRAPQLPEQPPVSAKYVFDQPTPEGGTIPMYNIENGPLHGTTVSAQTLEDMGLPVPEKTAPMQKPLTLEERQALEPPTVPIKPELNKPLPNLPIGEGESIGDYLRRSGVDNIHTTPDEQVVNRAAQVPDNGPIVSINKEPPVVPIEKPFDPTTLGFEGAAKPTFRANLDGTFTNKSTGEVVDNFGKPFDEAEFVNPTTGEIIPESLAGQGDIPLNAPPVIPGIAGRSATKRMGSPDLGLEGVPNAAEMPPIQQPIQQPPTLNTNALSRPAMPDEPWSPVGSMPDEQIPLMDVAPQIPLQPAGVPRPPTPYQPAGVPITLGPPKPKAPMLGPQPPPPPIPPTPYQPAGIPKQLGPQPPKQPPMGPRKPPQPPANPLVPPPPPPPGPIRAALSAHKAWLTSLDLSAPGRQGKAFLFNKAWWTSLDDMGKAWWSKQGSDAVNDSIENHASGFFKQTQLPNGRKVQSWAEQMGLELPKHEEMFNNTAGKKFAEMTGIEKSSRAHTAFLNKLRSDQFASMIEASQKAGIDPIKRQDVAKAYAKFINDATGRGSVNFGSWKLERNMQMMNDVFFAPKNMSGQIRTWNNVLNPAKYYNYDPVLRKQALKSLFAVAGVSLGVGELARMAGAKVSNDPTSADFRKVRIGDTRIDMFGGYQQFPVAAMKLLTGESTSTISGRTTDLTAGRYGQQTRASVAERFFINRLSPVGSFIYAWMANREFDGKPFEVKRALFERTFPIAAKDIMELAQEDPALAAIMAPTTVTGLTGTQHYTGR